MLGCKSVTKICFVVVNTIIFACAIIEIVIAAVIYGRVYTLDMLSSLLNTSAMIILMTAGVLGLLITTFGIFGLKLHMRWVFCLYCILNFAIFVLQIAGFSSAFHYASQDLASFLSDMLSKYNSKDNSFITFAWDKMQQSLHCCGVIGPESWDDKSRPKSCSCFPGMQNCGANSYFTLGCYDATIWYSYDLTIGVAGLSAAMAILQLFAGGISLALASKTESKTMIL